MLQKSRYLFSLLLCAIIFMNWSTPTNDSWRQKVDPKIFLEAEQDTPIDFIISFKNQADLSGVKQLKTKDAKANYVFKQLQKIAQAHQTQVINLLEQENAAYHAFYIVNAIQAKGSLELIQQVAELGEVKSIEHNGFFTVEEFIPSTTSQSRTVEWGLEKINADDVWAMGYTGQGVVVAGADTGFKWDSPPLKDKYRGWNGSTANHNYNWHDAIHAISPLHEDPNPSDPNNNPCGLNSIVPCDDHEHGTFTMGIAVGEEGDNQIGVAPDSKWIACRNMERGYGQPSTYIECLEWFLAPTDLNNANPDPTKAPHVINNSWGCPEMEGCNASNWATMEQVVNTLKASGIVVVTSAGNSNMNGALCSTITSPPAIFENAYAVGASDINDNMAPFSSWGPINVDGSGRQKPNVVAPGMDIRSVVLDGSYEAKNGTSAAGPFVAGLVALIISANPALAGDVETIETIIEQTAVPKTSNVNCGDISGSEVPNNSWGYGRIDALAAVQMALNTVDIKTPSTTTSQLVPNPFTDNIRFDYEGFTGKTTLQLFNSTGQVVVSFDWILAEKGNKNIQLKDLPSGVYFYQIQNGENRIGGKLVKK